jgi:hypothetical protein
VNGLSEVISQGARVRGNSTRSSPFGRTNHRPSFEERTGVAERPLGHREKEIFTAGMLSPAQHWMPHAIWIQIPARPMATVVGRMTSRSRR